VVPNENQLAPQVVTVIHRLSGVKLLRLLQRQSGENFTIDTIDPETLMSDAHASILVGWALEDGKTIAARLPQAFAEIDVTDSPETRARALAAAAGAPSMLMRPRLEPDLTVITREGQRFRAHLVGVDGETGLSIMQLIGKLPPPPPAVQPLEVKRGQQIEIFTPQPLHQDLQNSARNTYVQVGKVEATIALAGPAAPPADKLVASGKFSPSVIGGIACDNSGNTVGIVDAIESDSLSILPAVTVQAATKRVLARQASVPRPWLGVQGEPLEVAGAAALLAHGWRDDQVKDLLADPVGIFLTTVKPKTPAAFANLQAGDVIVRVNEDQIKSADEFSDLLGKAGSGEQVKLTVRRPASTTPVEVPVTLGASFGPAVQWSFAFAAPPMPLSGFERWGMQTLGLGNGGENGLVVVAVRPESVAARGGIREGDVIESVDGQVVGRRGYTFALTAQKKHTVSIVRDREKKQVVLEVEE
jgi:membrane-associated protease RseP (regulator of RpoE activity)